MPEFPAKPAGGSAAEASLVQLDVPAGEPFYDELIARGAEFPCGGEGTCGYCRLRVREGALPAADGMSDALTAEQLLDGWRLGCLAVSAGPVVAELAQWAGNVIAAPASPPAPAMRPRLEIVPPTAEKGLAVAVDLGTTTLVAQLIDLQTGAVLSTETVGNPQRRWGADLMSRIRHDLAHPGELTTAIRGGAGELVARVANGRPVAAVLLVGNTVMQHLFCGRSIEPLATSPFRSPYCDAHILDAGELGWSPPTEGPVHFAPSLGGFVGSDLLAGILACGMHRCEEPVALLDLGTNGEIALSTGTVGSGEILCASTAAGPAFEAANISCGMRAEPGAIHRVTVADGTLRCEVLGNQRARGICGSGLVDAVASALQTDQLQQNGRLAKSATTQENDGSPATLPLADGIHLTQRDIRELQLAKAAIASGLALLEREAGLRARRLFLAGAFGNCLRVASARRIGLLPSAAIPVEPVGNAALHGARQLLLSPPQSRNATLNSLRHRCRHVELASLAGFQDAFVDALSLQLPSALSVNG
jgi:uncharacterized 2Fe-2S/4Fe-4S cluster protein (DUF4445 family)